jgi:hypothetical protein
MTLDAYTGCCYSEGLNLEHDAACCDTQYNETRKTIKMGHLSSDTQHKGILLHDP